MCQFFSFVGDGFGNYRYLDWEYRKNHLEENCDSHTLILTEAKVPPEIQNKWSKYEYNPFTKKFTVDQGVEGHSHEDAEAWVSKLNFKTIVEPLIIKKTLNPFKLKKRNPTQEDIKNLESWELIRKSMKSPVKNLIQNLIKKSIESSIRELVWDLVWESAKDLIWDLVWKSEIEESWEIAWEITNIYFASFFDLDYGYDFSPLWKLWDRGLVPFLDNTILELRSGTKKEIVYSKEL